MVWANFLLLYLSVCIIDDSQEDIEEDKEHKEDVRDEVQRSKQPISLKTKKVRRNPV